MGNRFKRDILKEQSWILRQTIELQVLIRELNQIDSILSKESKINKVKQLWLKNVLEVKVKRVKDEEKKISRFERRIHRFRKRIDVQIDSLSQELTKNQGTNNSSNSLGGEINKSELSKRLVASKAEIDIHEKNFLKHVSYPKGLIYQELNINPINWPKVRKLVNIAKISLLALLTAVRKLNQIREYLMAYEKQKHLSHSEEIKERYSPDIGGFRYQFFFKAREMYASLIYELMKAEHSIYLETFIFDPDEVGEEIVKVLIKKAKEFDLKNSNKEIVLIIDGIGSPHNKSLKSKFKAVIEEMQKVGIQVNLFNPISDRVHKYKKLSVLRHPILSSSCDHRKLTIIDEKVAFIGGMNISQNYFSIRDTHMKVTGEIVSDLTSSFKQMLLVCQKYESLALSRIDKRRWEIRKEYKQMKKEKRRLASLFKMRNYQVISNSPSLLYHDIRDEYLLLIDSAKNTINITTPFFYPGRKFIDALCDAALRGVKVRLLLPKHSDHPLMDKGARKYFKKLLSSGVEIYLYSSHLTSFVHAKTMTVDGLYSTVGSSNLDHVSLTLSYELNIFFLNQSIAKDLDNQFERDLKSSYEYTLEMLKKDKKEETISEKVRLFLGHRVLSPILRPKFPGYD